MNMNKWLSWSMEWFTNRLNPFLTKTWPYLTVVLVVIIAIQAWGLAWLHSEVNNQETSTNEDPLLWGSRLNPGNQGTLSPWPNDPFKDNFFANPFDWKDWRPFQEMQKMLDRMNGTFGDTFGFFSPNPRFGDSFDSGSFTPEIDIEEKDDRFIVTIDLPGADESNVDISCREQELTISGSLDQLRESKEDHHGGNLLQRERRTGHFSQTVSLPTPVQVDKMETKFDKGIVTVTIPKAAP